MPVISSFYGVIIRMFYQEHEPPHFHAEHGGDQATFSLGGELLLGRIRSRRARQQISEWAVRHRRELETNWQHMKAGLPLERIEPLA
ncbi:MAG: DUF4160 domain-containing protein [Planctomycetia bacterium]|nr:DUF4160 domain-containing protein [Planctomycetia bacterium]